MAGLLALPISKKTYPAHTMPVASTIFFKCSCQLQQKLWLAILFVVVATNTSLAQALAKTHIPNAYVNENVFIKRQPNTLIPPKFSQIKDKLPQPFWPHRPDAIKSYYRAWEMAFANIHAVTNENGFVSPYIDAAFNKHLFMWDACFMTLFGRYGNNAFNFQQTLDNFYCKQHKDGFICRQLSQENGEDRFERFDVTSTGPNIFPWAEWEYFLNFNDKQRLTVVFAPMLAYYQWYRQWRSWQNGTYFSSGWGSGMDNQPRMQLGYDFRRSHGFMSWIDITLQQVYMGKLLVQMAAVLGREDDIKDIVAEIEKLSNFVNHNMWDDKTSFYYDRYKNGELSYLKTVGAYWALLANIVPNDRKPRFIAHLANSNEFARKHRVPSWAANNPNYNPDGGYWQGAVWAPTTYMVLRGLTSNQQDSLAYQIAKNHFDNVTEVFNQTGTFWENYAPDKVQGNNRKDFVGWTALTPIAVLMEYIFGIRPDVPQNMLIWDICLTDEFGVKDYPFGKDGLINLSCKKRNRETDVPEVSIVANTTLKVHLKWQGGSKWLTIQPQINKK